MTAPLPNAGEHPSDGMTDTVPERFRTLWADGRTAVRRDRNGARNASGRQPAPEGFRIVRVHDLNDTYGRKLRAAGASFEDRQDLLGHKSTRITTHYSAAKLETVIAAAEPAVRAAGFGPSEAETLPESELEQRVFGPAPPGKPPKLVPPDYAWVHTELKRHRHVTLQLLWEEYVERHRDAAYRRRLRNYSDIKELNGAG